MHFHRVRTCDDCKSLMKLFNAVTHNITLVHYIIRSDWMDGALTFKLEDQVWDEPLLWAIVREGWATFSFPMFYLLEIHNDSLIKLPWCSQLLTTDKQSRLIILSNWVRRSSKNKNLNPKLPINLITLNWSSSEALTAAFVSLWWQQLSLFRCKCDSWSDLSITEAWGRHTEVVLQRHRALVDATAVAWRRSKPHRWCPQQTAFTCGIIPAQMLYVLLRSCLIHVCLHLTRAHCRQ